MANDKSRRDLVRKNIIVLMAWVVCDLSLLAPSVHAQMPDTVRVPLTSDTLFGIHQPQGIAFGFNHVLSIYEWNGAFDYSDGTQSIRSAAIMSTASEVHLNANSRFLPQDSLATTEATGSLTVVQPLMQYQPGTTTLAPFILLAASSYATSPRLGTLAALLITKQISGIGIGGLKLQMPDHSLISFGVGLAHKTQSAFGESTVLSSAAPTAGLSATGLMLSSEDSAAAWLITDGAAGSAAAHLDERFFRERAERFSNDSIRIQLISGLNDPLAAQNAAYLQLGLLRRDFFFNPDTATEAIKQERTEYAFALTDSLSYPILDDRVRAHLALELEPRDVTRRSDVSSGEFGSNTFSAFSTLMAPSEISSMRLATEGRLTFGNEAMLYRPAIPDSTISPWSSEMRLRYEERSETIRLLATEITGLDEASIKKLSETLDQASYSARTTTTNAVLRYQPSARDEAEIDATARILSYDTPSTFNDDDHDDLLTGLRAGYRRIISDNLNWQASLRVSRDHLVYLQSDRSAQNAITRSIIFNSLATLATPQIFASAGGEVFANYTIFDYINSLPLLSNIGNYLLRGMTVTDTLAIPIAWRMPSSSLTLEQAVSLRISERGGFSDQAFTERRDASVTELSASLLLGLASKLTEPRWSIRMGARGFFLSRSGRGTGALSASLAPFSELERQSRIGPEIILTLGQPAWLRGPSLTGSLWYAILTSQHFDVPSYTRSTQLESHLMAAWTF
ncbi:MAG: hypothetical protein Q8922_02725 [Bacteroidota bacterium]|nr:hypothetical protein [Bacteroidota bacterium]MDP4232880.1 hypothetical protein [Bacteroidota bacterium]MDP4241924.1 hypothetical protein [Bacteroidota bacterium]MDP4286827.1 hypothetical protein [Bacteroidota bacterium]